MAKSRRSRYRSSPVPTILMIGTAVGLIGLAGVTVAWALGAFEPERTASAEPIDRTGMLAFPALAQPVPAFEAISRVHLINKRTRQLNVVWLPEATKEVASRSVGDLIGRVLRRDKTAGMVLTERDFLPEGTKPGFSAGIPPGKFAITIPTEKIPGLAQLRHGDRFDFMVSLTNSDGDQAISNSEPAALFGGIKPPSLRVSQLSRQHGVKRLVTGGQLIALTQGKTQSTTGANGLTVKPSGRNSSKSTTYAEIAIDGEEIGPLTEAISLQTPMTCIIRSGRPDAEADEAFSKEGLVPVITTAKVVDAFSALTDENLVDESTGKLHYYYFPPDRVPEHWLTDPASLYGRVVGRSLRRGSPITETDLLPAGTKPGISAGVPEGMVAMAVSTEKISGFEDLSQGDQFAILAQVPKSSVKPLNGSWMSVMGGTLDPDAERVEKMLSTGIREVVPNAIYLRQSSDGSATIAVPDDRISQVAQLIRDQTELFVVAHKIDDSTSVNDNALQNASGKSGAPEDSVHLVATQIGADLDANANADQQVRVPILTRDVSAFEPISVDDFIDPATGQIRYVYFPLGRASAEWETDVSALIDRVALRAIKAGRAVSSRDVAAAGVPPGPSAGVPEGMQGLLVDSAQIEDLDLLGPGAKFAIVLGQTLAPGQLGDQVRRTISSADAVAEADKLPGLGVPVARMVATEAILLTAFDTVERLEQRTVNDRNTETRLDPNGTIQQVVVDEQPRLETSTRSVQRFAIAVPTAQAASLLAALDRNRPLRISVAGSGRSVPKSDGQSESLQTPHNGGLVKTFVREHFSGAGVPITEIFVSDRDYAGVLPTQVSEGTGLRRIFNE